MSETLTIEQRKRGFIVALTQAAEKFGVDIKILQEKGAFGAIVMTEGNKLPPPVSVSYTHLRAHETPEHLV